MESPLLAPVAVLLCSFFTAPSGLYPPSPSSAPGQQTSLTPSTADLEQRADGARLSYVSNFRPRHGLHTSLLPSLFAFSRPLFQSQDSHIDSTQYHPEDIGRVFFNLPGSVQDGSQAIGSVQILACTPRYSVLVEIFP